MILKDLKGKIIQVKKWNLRSNKIIRGKITDYIFVRFCCALSPLVDVSEDS